MPSSSRFDNLVWPRWLPVTARMAVIAQITGAVALTALIMGPWWSSITPPLETRAVALFPTPLAAPVAAAPAQSPSPAANPRPAHLNLDVRHTFGSVELTVTVDNARVVDETLDGSARRFRMFGKRAERGYTRTLDLAPGVRVVRVRVRAPKDKFDQSRVERFELASSAVAGLRIAADKSGLSIVAERPAPPKPPPAVPRMADAGAAPPAAPVDVPPPIRAAAAAEADAIAELLQSMRSILIAIAGFVASAATGFVVQEFMRSRRGVLFTAKRRPQSAAVPE